LPKQGLVKLCFLWPIVTHVLGQKELCRGEGRIVFILASARELSNQFFSESKAYSKLYDCELNFHVSDGNWT